MSEPDDTILLVFPDGGGVPISREAFDDATEAAAPIREYLERAFWKPGDPGPPPELTEHDLWMQERT